MTVQYGIDIVAYHSLFWAKQAVREGRCSALLYDDIAIVADLRETQWSRQFEMPMPTLYQTPWSVAIARCVTATKTVAPACFITGRY